MEPAGELDLTRLRPKRWLLLRLMVDGRSKWFTLSALGLWAVALALALAGAFVVAHERRFAREARTTKGKVTRKWWLGGRGERTCLIRYTFEADDGREHDGKATFSASRAEPIRQWDFIDIQYLPSNPHDNRPVDTGIDRRPWALVYVAACVAALGLVPLEPAARHAAKIATLLRHGVLTRATIFEKPEQQSGATGGRYSADVVATSLFAVRYWFETPDGQAHTGDDVVRDLGWHERQRSGATVAVLYLPKDPRRSAVFRPHWRSYFEASDAT